MSRLPRLILPLLLLLAVATAAAAQTYRRLFDDAFALQRRGSYTEALALWNQAIAQNQEDPAAYLNRGLTRFYLKDLPGSVEDLSTAIARKNDYATAYLNRGLVLHTLKEDTAAAADLDRYLILAPNSPDARQVRGLLTELRRRTPAAATAPNRSVAPAPTGSVATPPPAASPNRPLSSAPTNPGSVPVGRISGYDATTDDLKLGLRRSLQRGLIPTDSPLLNQVPAFVSLMQAGNTVDESLARSGLGRQLFIRLTWRGAAYRTYRIDIR